MSGCDTNLVTRDDLYKAKRQSQFIADVGTGGPNETVTNPDTGVTVPTIQKVLSETGFTHSTPWDTNPRVTESLQVIPYNNQLFLPNTLPYQVDSASHPDPNALVPSELRDVSKFVNENSIGGLTNYQASNLSSMKNGITTGGQKVSLAAGQCWKLDGYNTAGDGGAATYIISDVSGSDNFDIDLGNGLWAILQIGTYIFFPQIGGVDGQDPTFNSVAIDAAIKKAETLGGRTILMGPYVNRFTDPIKLRETVSIKGIDGADRGLAGVMYVGKTFQDFVTSESGHRDYIGIERLIVYGGEYQQGHARYSVGFDAFNTRSYIKDCYLRDGFGLLRIDSGFYCTLDNVQCGRPTPKQDSVSPALTNGEWGQVYSGKNAPVKLVEMNASVINRLQVSQPTSEPTTGVVPIQAVFISGETPVINGMTLESVGVPYDTFNPTCEIGITSEVVGVFNGLYMESVHTTTDFIRTVGYARTAVKGFTFYNGSGDTFARCLSVGDLTMEDGQVWRADFRRLDYTQGAGSSDFGDGSDVTFDRVSWRSGGSNIIQDTKDTNNKNGCISGPVNDAQKSNKYVRFPRVTGGLTVTVGTDGNGALCTIQNGTYISQDGKKINGKVAVAIGSSIQPQILRPDVASRYWRVYIGKAGNFYMEKSESEFTDPRGDWISSFRTDNLGAPFDLKQNERLTLDGIYIGGTSKALIYRESNQVPTFVANNGDVVENTSGTSGQPIGWVYQNGWISRGVYP